MKDSKAVIICYDVTNKDSFDSVNRWLAEASENIFGNFLTFLAGNKSDQEEARQVSFEEGQAYANKREFTSSRLLQSMRSTLKLFSI